MPGKKAISPKSVIKNYGLMWRRDAVFWGRYGKKGFLEGRRSGHKIDFTEQIGVYVLYDEDRRPVYVGQAGNGNAGLFRRLRAHRRDSLKHRWAYFSWFGLRAVNKNGSLSGWAAPTKRVGGTMKSMLNEIEGVLIAAMEPAFNKQGARFRGIARYNQIEYENTEDVTLVVIRDLLQDLQKQVGMKSDR